MKKRTEIFSIFGQIEEVVALAMIEEGTAHKIAFEMIPQTVAYDDRGERAKFAIVLAANLIPAFEKRVAALRA